jgi:DNA helicase-2/ATP-dependent DNA helicase PcrA
MNYLSELNKTQQEAVQYKDGPQLVIAGAGSGKTRVLTYKIAYLLQQGVSSGNILALTFTNKAAREMRERIMQLVDPKQTRYLTMGTFHSVCARILRQEAELLGFTSKFTIYDTSDSKGLVKRIVKEKGLDDKLYKSSVILNRISDAKNHLIDPIGYANNRHYMQLDRMNRLYEIPSIYAAYQQQLRQSNAMDFDDLLMNMNILLQQNKEVRQKYQEIFQYVLVDEYQDTNYSQYLIVKTLAEPQNNICVVGDDAQAIYSFRGANIQNILKFQQGYTNAQLFKLEQNYRSTQNIVNAANSLIAHNVGQIHKQVFSEKEPGQPLQLTAYPTDLEESAGVAKRIALLHKNKRSYEDIAVLYRTNAQSRTLENEFRKAGIPYRIYGGTSFYQRKEIKDAIAYFRLVVNPYDVEALLRIINFPTRGIGNTTLKKLTDFAYTKQIHLIEVFHHLNDQQLSISSRTVNQLNMFFQLIQSFVELSETLDAYQFAEHVLKTSGVLTSAAMDLSPEGIDRMQNLQELLNGIQEFVSKRKEEGIDFTPITDFLSEVSLLTDQDEKVDDHTPRITLMTVHAAKGLEFPITFIVGLEENLFPSPYCESESEMEEERRLLYVAITRSMELCHLTYSKQRFKNGSISYSSPSRFINDINPQFVQNTVSVQAPVNRWSNFSWGETSSFPSSPQPTKSPSATPTHRHLTRVPSNVRTSVGGEQTWKVGDRVFHKVFKEGTVQKVYSTNDSDKIDINFDEVGTKTLLLAFAKLEKR